MRDKLEVGDKVYETYHSNPSGRVFVIERVTMTKAVSSSKEFRRDISPYGSIRKWDGASWSINSYHLETPELIEQVKRLKLIDDISNSKLSNTSTEDLERIYTLLNPNTNV